MSLISDFLFPNAAGAVSVGLHVPPSNEDEGFNLSPNQTTQSGTSQTAYPQFGGHTTLETNRKFRTASDSWDSERQGGGAMRQPALGKNTQNAPKKHTLGKFENEQKMCKKMRVARIWGQGSGLAASSRPGPQRGPSAGLGTVGR